MKKIVKTPKKVEKVVEVVTEEVESVVETDGGPVTMLGKEVFVSCTSYAYTGVLSGVNGHYVELSSPKLVYETGPWSGKDWKDAQSLPTRTLTIFQAQIESMFVVER